MENKQNSFMFYDNFLEAIEQLPESERANACYQLCRYALNDELPKDKSLAMFCIGVKYSVHKYQGRGGARIGAGRPKSSENQEKKSSLKNQKNQKIQKNQNTQTETETETEDKEEAKPKNKTSSSNIDFNRRESFMRADPKSLVDALKRDIVPNLCAYLYTGKEPTDEQLNNYVQMRTSTGWEKKGGTPIRSIGADLASWLKREKEEQPQRNEFGQPVFKMSDKPMTYEEMIAQTKE